MSNDEHAAFLNYPIEGMSAVQLGRQGVIRLSRTEDESSTTEDYFVSVSGTHLLGIVWNELYIKLESDGLRAVWTTPESLT